MEPMTVVGLAWLGGVVAYVAIARSRAGLRLGERAHRSHGAAGRLWATTHAPSGLACPVSLMVWFARGHPPVATRFRD